MDVSDPLQFLRLGAKQRRKQGRDFGGWEDQFGEYKRHRRQTHSPICRQEGLAASRRGPGLWAEQHSTNCPRGWCQNANLCCGPRTGGQEEAGNLRRPGSSALDSSDGLTRQPAKEPGHSLRAPQPSARQKAPHLQHGTSHTWSAFSVPHTGLSKEAVFPGMGCLLGRNKFTFRRGLQRRRWGG